MNPRSVRVAHRTAARVRFEVPRDVFEPDIQAGIEAALTALPGVLGVRFNAPARSLVVEHAPGTSVRALRRTIAKAQPRTPERSSRGASPGSPDRHLRSVAAFGAAGALALTGTPLALPLIGLGSLAIFRRAAKRASRGKIGVDALDASAMVLTVATGQWMTAAVLGALVEGGELLRDLTARRSRRELGALMSHQGASCWKLVDGRRVRAKVGDVRAGDRVLVASGDRVPVDGTVLRGRALVDERLLTGEPMPVLKEKDARVFAMTVVGDGDLVVEAATSAADSRAGRIMSFLESAPIGETRMADHARRIADRFVLPVMGTAALVGALTGSPARAASILIFDLASGIRVAAPTTMLASLIGAAREGILIKGAAAMEKLADVDAIVFDKTGTLTMGRPAVADITAFNGLAPNELLAVAAGADHGLNHPLAGALVAEAEARGVTVPQRQRVAVRIGLGVEAELEGGRTFLVGNRDFMREHSVRVPRRVNGHGLSEVIVASQGECLGAIEFRDEPRPGAGEIVDALRQKGVRRIALLSGDVEHATHSVARSLGIREWHARMSPDGKADFVRRLKAEGHRVAVVGDGMNDSVAFALADLSIAMGGGADMARANSDVILLDDRLELLPRAIERSRDSLQLMNQNLALIAAPNAFGLGSAIAGGINPAVAAFLSNGSTVVAAANGLRPLLAKSPAAAATKKTRGRAGTAA
ncbi:MAG TPA: heavy metal translocating P-type ATPase [Candidatus Dormibacteraeota bacterium]|nr:heavy metal translocating P-type ATPase [Candidatus Dormibacteraeota bacterium]